MLESLGLILAGFIGTELVSIPLHRYIFHGLLWEIHKSHHSPRHGPFEHNDLFSLFFATLSIALMAMGVFWPGMAISLTVLSVNYLGDGLRDALDPRIRGR